LYGILRREKTSRIGSAIGATILVFALCVVSKLNGARPDTLALAFALAGLLAVQTAEYSWRGLFIASVCWLAAFSLKQYLILPALAVGLYIFLFRSKSRALIWGALFAALLLGSSWLVRIGFPTYFRYAFLHYAANSDLSRDHMVWQFSYFLEWYVGLCLLLLIIWHRRYFRWLSPARLDIKLGTRMTAALFPAGARIPLWDFGVLLNAVLLVFYLGQHRWNDHVYFQELLLPFLLVAVIPIAESMAEKPAWRVLVYGAMLTCLLPLGNTFQTEFPAYAAGYRSLEKRLDRCEHVFGSPPIADYLYARGQPVYDSGASGYGKDVLASPSPAWAYWFGGEDSYFANRWAMWEQEMQGRVETRAFDCIAIDETVTDLAGIPLDRFYKKSRVFPDILGSTIVLWVPLDPNTP
jgi:hypothetical protein